MRFALFMVLSAAVSGIVHGYVWHRLIGVLKPSSRHRRAITAAMAVLYLLVPLSTSSRFWAPSLASVLGWIAGPWLAFVGVAATALGVRDAGHLVARLVQRARRRSPEASGVSRRQFLTRLTGGTAVAVAGASVGRGVFAARGEHEVVDVEVALTKLPRQLDGFSIVQLSDLHIGMTIDRGFVQRVVDRTNALAPDLIALTGDLVDGPVPSLRDDAAPLSTLRAKHGVFAVTGNHEYYTGADAWIEELSRLGVRYLRNERVPIAVGPHGFELAGVDDHEAARWDGHGEDLARATAGRDPKRALVLLAHQPRQVVRAAKHGVDLQLSGHTHGGQIWPWHFIVKQQQRGYLAGRYTCGETQLYVTRGCGYWGAPVRVLAPLEITRVVLRAA